MAKENKELTAEELIAKLDVLQATNKELADRNADLAKVAEGATAEGEIHRKKAEENQETLQRIAEHYENLEKDNMQLSKANAQLAKAAKDEAAKLAPPSFEVDDDPDNDIDGGDYEFTCPTFTWDDGSVINVRELIADAEGDERKAAEKAQAILSKLIERKSGVVKRKED